MNYAECFTQQPDCHGFTVITAFEVEHPDQRKIYNAENERVAREYLESLGLNSADPIDEIAESLFEAGFDPDCGWWNNPLDVLMELAYNSNNHFAFC